MLRSILFLLVALLFPTVFWGADFVKDKDYQVITDTKFSKKPTVIEFFSYGCPWCYHLQSPLEKWAKSKKDLHFMQIPVIFHKNWMYYAKAYYIAKLLNQQDKLNPLLFKAIQTDKMTLNSNQAMINFFVKEGIDKETAESAFLHSTTVEMNIAQGNRIMSRYHINSVPAFIVNHRYKTDLQMAQNEARLLQILDYLLTIKEN